MPLPATSEQFGKDSTLPTAVHQASNQSAGRSHSTWIQAARARPPGAGAEWPHSSGRSAQGAQPLVGDRPSLLGPKKLRQTLTHSIQRKECELNDGEVRAHHAPAQSPSIEALESSLHQQEEACELHDAAESASCGGDEASVLRTTPKDFIEDVNDGMCAPQSSSALVSVRHVNVAQDEVPSTSQQLPDSMQQARGDLARGARSHLSDMQQRLRTVDPHIAMPIQCRSCVRRVPFLHSVHWACALKVNSRSHDERSSLPPADDPMREHIASSSCVDDRECSACAASAQVLVGRASSCHRISVRVYRTDSIPPARCTEEPSRSAAQIADSRQ